MRIVQALAAILLLLLPSSAFALNACGGPDGQVTSGCPTFDTQKLNYPPAIGDSSSLVPTTSTLTASTVRTDRAQSLTPAQQGQARTNAAAAVSGANGDITSLTGLTTPLPATEGGNGLNVAASADGCVRVVVTNATTLTESPFGCNTIIVNAVPVVVTTKTISNSGLAASTVYGLYDTGTALYLSTVGHVTGSDGREYANNNGSANLSYRLVALVATNASTQFADSLTFRGLLNYFNRGEKELQGANINGAGVPSTAGANSGFAVSALTWAGDGAEAEVKGFSSVATAGAYITTQVYVDGSSAGTPGTGTASAANAYVPATGGWRGSLTEGLHTFSPGTALNSGGANVNIAVSGKVRG